VPAVAKLTIGEAAALLHAAPSTIRSWEQRLGYPRPDRSTSGRRLYDENEIGLLADALQRGLSISSAIRLIQEQTGAHETLLHRALSALDLASADALLEAAIAVRGVSRAFDDAVLPALDRLFAEPHEPCIPALAVEWVGDRACWSRRQAPRPGRRRVVIVDGSVEGTATRAASCVLQLQLVLRSARTDVLHGAAGSAYRKVACLVDADVVVFVGAPPATAARGTSLLTAHVCAYRPDGDRLYPRVDVLPQLPRLAVDRMLAAVEHPEARALA
jgi:DNA-binding transcriptional MerR regulator